MNGVTNDNGGDELFQVRYKPSYRSAMRQSRLEEQVDINWEIEVDSAISFYIKLSFIYSELIS